jgi:hypothetical protein
MPVSLTTVAELWRGDPGGVAWDGDVIVVGLGPRLAVLDPSRDGFAMVLGATPPFMQQLAAVSAADGLAVAVMVGGEVATVDISNPTAPRVLDRVQLEIGNWSLKHFEVARFEHYAYVSTGGRGVAIVDLADPADLHAVGWVEGLQNVVAMVIEDGSLFTIEDRFDMDFREPLKAFDLSLPEAPERIAELDLGFSAAGDYRAAMAVRDGLLVAQLLDGLHVLDVSAPERPRQVGRRVAVASSGEREQLVLAGRWAILGTQDGDSELTLIDVSTPSLPRVETSVAVSFGTYWFATNDTGDAVAVSTLAQADYSDGNFHGTGAGAAVLRLADGGLPSLYGRMHLPFDVTALDCGGAWCYFAEQGIGGGSLQALDLTSPREPRLAGDITWPEGVSALAVHGNVVVGISAQHLLVADVSDPGRPRAAASQPLGEQLVSLTLDGGYAFITDRRRSLDAREDSAVPLDLLVLDLADPTRPRLRDRYALDAAALTPPLADGSTLYALSQGRRGQRWQEVDELPTILQVLDARDPDHLRELARLPLPIPVGPFGLALDGTTLWAAGLEPGILPDVRLFRIDVARPSAPLLDGSSRIRTYLRSMLATGRQLVSVDCNDHLTVFDVARPGDVLAVGGLPLPTDRLSGLSCGGNNGGVIAQANGHFVIGRGRRGIRVVASSPPLR